MNNSYLNGIVSRLDNITNNVVNNFNSLDEKQINWKYSPDKWSIGQCLEHIMVTNEQYLTKIMTINAGKSDDSIGTKIPLLPGLLGKFLSKSVRPEAKLKVKAPGIFQPSTGTIRRDIVAEFQKHQSKLKELVVASDKSDHKKTLISSPVSGFFGLYLFDAINILTSHEERHYQQAMRVLNEPNFGKYS